MGEGQSPQLKTSENEKIQERVDREKAETFAKHPSAPEALVHENARRTVAGQLRVDRLKRDVRKEKEEKEEAQKKSMVDSLTGLHNRRWLNSELERRIKELNRIKHDNKNDPNSLWILYFDIDRFKSVNDSFGDQVGDEILRAMKEIRSRPTEEIARVGGEEFAVIVFGNKHEQNFTRMMELYEMQFSGISEEVLKEANPIIDGELTTDIPRKTTLSFGVVEYEPGEALEDFLGRAGIAMHKAKERGRNRGVLMNDGELKEIFIGE